MDTSNKFILITGTSSGIGKACVLELDKLGFKIFATVRKQEDANNLKKETSKNVLPVIMDITDNLSIKSAYEVISKITDENGLYALINNAGIAIGGPLEFIPLDDVRKHFEVNVFGHIAVIQSFLKLLRKGKGRIINISSIDGKVITPFLVPYSASKFALEAFSDALNIELKAWNIPVTTINPGNIKTQMWMKSIENTRKQLSTYPEEMHVLYDKTMNKVLKAATKVSEYGISPNNVTKAVVRALYSKKPKRRYIVGLDANIMYYISKYFPESVIYKLVTKFMGIN